jgi:hypothetical protein
MMSVDRKVIEVFESFVLGICKCNCGTEINIRQDHYLKRYVKGHFRRTLKGENHWNWKGGKALDKRYKQIWSPNHPFRNGYGCVLEHRLVMEKHIGRYLLPEEVVHHMNKNIRDNRIENLMLFPNNKEHLKYERSIRPKNRCSNPNCKDPENTYVDKNGYDQWFRDGKGQYLCSKCYNRKK